MFVRPFKKKAGYCRRSTLITRKEVGCVCQLTTLSKSRFGGGPSSQWGFFYQQNNWSSKQNGALRSVSTKKRWKVQKPNHFQAGKKKTHVPNSRKVPNKNLRLPKKKTSGAKVVLPSQCSWKHRWKHRHPLKLPSSQKKTMKKTSGYCWILTCLYPSLKIMVWKRWFFFLFWGGHISETLLFRSYWMDQTSTWCFFSGKIFARQKCWSAEYLPAGATKPKPHHLRIRKAWKSQAAMFFFLFTWRM